MGMASMRSDPIEVGRSLEDMLRNCSRRTSNNFRTRRELKKRDGLIVEMHCTIFYFEFVHFFFKDIDLFVGLESTL